MTFRSNNPEHQNSPHWIGEFEGVEETPELSDDVTRILDYIEKNESPVWGSLAKKRDYKNLVNHIVDGAIAKEEFRIEEAKKAGEEISETEAKHRISNIERRATISGLDKSIEQTEKIIEDANRFVGFLDNTTLDEVHEEFMRKDSTVAAVLTDFWVSSALEAEEYEPEPRFDFMVVEESIKELNSLIDSHSHLSQEIFSTLVAGARKNAWRIGKHFSSELGRAKRRKEKFPVIKSKDKTPKPGTISDPYVQESIDRTDRYWNPGQTK